MYVVSIEKSCSELKIIKLNGSKQIKRINPIIYEK